MGICSGDEEVMNMFPNERGKPILNVNAYSPPEAVELPPFSFKERLLLPSPSFLCIVYPMSLYAFFSSIPVCKK